MRSASSDVQRSPRAESALSLRTRIEAVRILLDGGSFRNILATLDRRCWKDLQRFVWDVGTQILICAGCEEAVRAQLTRFMEPTRRYMARMGCESPLYCCKAADCLDVHPACAARKFMHQIDALALAINRVVRDHEAGRGM